MSEQTADAALASADTAWIGRVLRIEWLGQTVASLCWIASVFVYNSYGPGDWLQLAAASAWFIANVAAAVSSQGD